jgi:hypothetical protein
MQKAKRDPKSALQPDALYFGDNSRITCGELGCAGMSAHFSGRTISGQRVQRVTVADNDYFLRELGCQASCENCKKVFKS